MLFAFPSYRLRWPHFYRPKQYESDLSAFYLRQGSVCRLRYAAGAASRLRHCFARLDQAFPKRLICFGRIMHQPLASASQMSVHVRVCCDLIHKEGVPFHWIWFTRIGPPIAFPPESFESAFLFMTRSQHRHQPQIQCKFTQNVRILHRNIFPRPSRRVFHSNPVEQGACKKMYSIPLRRSWMRRL